MSPLVFPAFPFLATLGPVMIKQLTGDVFLDGTRRPWRFLRSLPAAHFPPLQGRHLALYVKGHWGEGIAGARPTAAAVLCPSPLSVDHFNGSSALLDG